MSAAGPLPRRSHRSPQGEGTPVRTAPRRPALLPFWLAVVCLLWSLGVCAQPAPLQIGSAPQYPLSRAFSYLDDSTAALTLQDVLAPAHQARFIPVTQVEATTNFGATRSAIWLRVQLQATADAPAPWLLEIANPALDRLDL